MTTPVALPAKEGHCEQCGLEITTGMMAALCPQARNCCMWPHAGGSYDPAVIDAELFMANAWIDNACEQIGLPELQPADAARRIRDALRHGFSQVFVRQQRDASPSPERHPKEGA